MGSEGPSLEGAGGGVFQNPTDAFSPSDFRRLAEHLPHMVWICRPDGTLDYINSHGLRYFGVKLRDSIALFPSGAITHPDDHEGSRAAWTRALEVREGLSMEARLLRSDGAFRWHLIRAEPICDGSGQVVKWMGTSTNVHSVKEGNELSAFLLELSTGFARIDNPHELVSTAMLRLRQHLGAAQVTLAEFDHDRGEAVMLRQDRTDSSNLQVVNLPLGPFESLSVEARNGSVTVLRNVPQDEPVANLYSRWYGLDSVRAVVSAPLLQGGALVASLSVVEDSPRSWSAPEVELTRRVAELVWPALEKARSDHALAVSEQRLRLAQAVAQIGAWELNPDVHTLHFSDESYELFGLTENAQINLYQLWVSLIDPRDRNALQDLVDECNRSGTAEAEYRYRHPTRGMRWIHTRAGRVDDEVPKVIVGISLDVTERRKAEEALKDVNHHKDEFLAMLAHELRNPLAPIRNAAQILRAHSTGQPELEWARTVIERQTRHLVRLVDDLLDVSRMVRGKIVLKKASVELAELVQHAVDTSQPLIRSRRHQLHVSIPSESLTIEGDLTRLAQAFANLLNNAAKYTDEGGQIWLDVWVEEREVVLRVRDTGPGISGKLLPHVFDLFTQAERTLDRAQGGLGIGLTLVKLLVELHGGAVEARNADNGTGAEFIVRLPTNAEVPVVLPVDAARPAQAPNQSGEKPLKVLVVDDNVDAADSIALLLTIDGFEAHSVHGAVAALDTVSSFKPDIVLLDIGLPVMDGYEVAQRLRAHIPIEQMRIVALSGYGQQADRERAAQAGFDDYLVKPVEPTVLSQFLRSLL
ncbi:MAG TPA: ATP-binding protein [Steroidobacteraceae bacterium]|nr:ATP-binding protein [Steroidobacteraceae bacterium]